jgi:hypothetical protein
MAALGDFAPAVTKAAMTCPILRLCGSVLSRAWVNSRHCHSAAVMRSRLQSMSLQNWVCAYF